MAYYAYLLIDPRTEAAFYAGKGQGSRAWGHQREVERGLPGCNEGKRATIRSILEAGLDVVVDIAQTCATEAEAFALERELISRLDGLTNIHPGWLTAPERANRIAERNAAIAQSRDAAAQKARDRRLKKLLEIPGAEKHVGEVRQWFDANANRLGGVPASGKFITKRQASGKSPRKRKNRPHIEIARERYRAAGVPFYDHPNRGSANLVKAAEEALARGLKK